MKLPATETLSQLLHERGWRVTAQRELILQAVRDTEGHIAPEAIYRQLQATTDALNRSTVYRTFEMLEALGLLRHSHLAEGETRYQHAHDADHVHLVCTRCRVEREVAAEPLRRALQGAVDGLGVNEFGVDPTHHAIGGLCATCESRRGGGALDVVTRGLASAW